MSKRATFDELLEFANKVREAGGGNPIAALMPAVPADASQCLIAKNLNFNCEVDGAYGLYQKNGKRITSSNLWVMSTDKETAEKISKALKLRKAYSGDGRVIGVILPAEIGQVAADFDASTGHISLDERWNDEKQRYEYHISDSAESRDLKRLRDFLPYIEESIREEYENALAVNDRGEIIG